MALIIRHELAGLLPLGVGYAALPLGIVFSQLAGARTPALSSSDFEAGLEPESRRKG
jgi:hypothetical protein